MTIKCTTKYLLPGTDGNPYSEYIIEQTSTNVSGQDSEVYCLNTKPLWGRKILDAILFGDNPYRSSILSQLSLVSADDITTIPQDEWEEAIQRQFLSPVSLGGARGFSKNDTIAAEVFHYQELPLQTAIALFSHPLCLFLRFLLVFTHKRSCPPMDVPAAEQAILETARNILILKHCPFPESEDRNGNPLDLPEGIHYEDFIFQTLNRPADETDTLAEQIVRSVNSLLSPVIVQDFVSSIRNSRASAVKTCIETIFGVWKESFYRYEEFPGRLVDTDVFQEEFANEFDKFLTDWRIESGLED